MLLLMIRPARPTLAEVPLAELSVVAVFAVLFLHERPSVREWLGILMVGAGVLVLALKR